MWCNAFFPPYYRRLTERQRALILSYAEDETDVEGTVNGVANTTAGKQNLLGGVRRVGLVMILRGQRGTAWPMWWCPQPLPFSTTLRIEAPLWWQGLRNGDCGLC